MTQTLSADNIRYMNYQSEAQMPDIMQLVENDLSEPYTVYTYRYFINNWSKLCFLAYDGAECIGTIVCKLDIKDKAEPANFRKYPTDDKGQPGEGQPPIVHYKGYIAMLVVKKEYRKLKIGSTLVKMAVDAMIKCNVDEIVLEAEVTNKPALKLYENLGFLRDRRMFRYYLNGLDALRMKLWIDE